MRKTLGDTKEALEFLHKIDGMEPQMRDEFAKVIKKLVHCFTDDNHQAVVVYRDGTELSQVMALNCDEMECSNMLRSLERYLDFKHMEDAPPKEMFN